MVRGFTLIELLIVLAVIAALLAIVTPLALNAVNQAKAAQVAANFRNIKSAIESYFYTRTGDSLNTLTTLVNGGFLDRIPDGFSLVGSISLTAATAAATYTIKYTGGVDINRLRNILPEATGNVTEVTLDGTIVKWW
ncbi:MAG: type II secretion system GspH family protein [Pseudothermotoga sp.]|nr:type II secretion system GspH family protein [Pseudothermotoga sp.]